MNLGPGFFRCSLLTCNAAKDQARWTRDRAEPNRAMHAANRFACRIEARNRLIRAHIRHLCFGVDVHAAHGVVNFGQQPLHIHWKLERLGFFI